MCWGLETGTALQLNVHRVIIKDPSLMMTKCASTCRPVLVSETTQAQLGGRLSGFQTHAAAQVPPLLPSCNILTCL